MSIVGFARTAALIPGVLVFTPGVAAQTAPSDPARFVASIYADGREATVWAQWLDGARRGEWFSPRLTALWAQCDGRAHKIGDELGALDFDVATNSQGMEVKSFTVKTLSRDASHASVVAKLTPDNWVRKSDRENEIRYGLVWERGRWAIDDVHSVIEPNPWSLRALLSQYLACWKGAKNAAAYSRLPGALLRVGRNSLSRRSAPRGVQVVHDRRQTYPGGNFRRLRRCVDVRQPADRCDDRR